MTVRFTKIEAYATLMLSPEASLEEAKHQRNKLIKLLHPDATGGSCTEEAARITAAYDCIKNNRFADESQNTQNTYKEKNTRKSTHETELLNEYEYAVWKMNCAITEEDFKQVADLFNSLGAYKESKDNEYKCYEQIRKIRREKTIQTAKKQADSENYETAISTLKSEPFCKNDPEIQKIIEGYEKKYVDQKKKRKRNRWILCLLASTALISIIGMQATKAYSEYSYKNEIYSTAINHLNEGRYDTAIEEFSNISDFKDSNDMVTEAYYQKACSLMDSNPIEAYTIFTQHVSEYKDSDMQILKMKEQHPLLMRILAYKRGDYVEFGNYYIDDAQEKRPIEWLVAKQDSNYALLVTKDCLDVKSEFPPAEWEYSELREWLNTAFVDTAFTPQEKKMISCDVFDGDTNEIYGFPSDMVFVLSLHESERLLDEYERGGIPTAYAISQGAMLYEDSNYTAWLTRTIADDDFYVVGFEGRFYTWREADTDNCDAFPAIRPAIRINLSNAD